MHHARFFPLKSTVMKKVVLTHLLICMILIISAPAFSQTGSKKPKNIGLSVNKQDSLSQSAPIQVVNKSTPLVLSEIEIGGNIAKPGRVSLKGLTKRSVTVKELGYRDHMTGEFIGAYRYDGYSLYDLLASQTVQNSQKNLPQNGHVEYVIIENAKGQKVIFTFDEIFNATKLHQIIIATDVTPLTVGQRKIGFENFPDTAKIIAGNDLFGCRFIVNPVRIKIVSVPFTKNLPGGKEYTPICTIENLVDNVNEKIEKWPSGFPVQNLRTVFFGDNKETQTLQQLRGFQLRELLYKEFPLSESLIQSGLITVKSADESLILFSFSEVFNRNDQQDLYITQPEQKTQMESGVLFPTGDFTTARMVKNVSSITLDLK